MKKMTFLIISLVCFTVFSGCEDSTYTKKTVEPVTLTFFMDYTDNEMFRKNIADPIKKKFPHVQVNPIARVFPPERPVSLLQHLEDGKAPDIWLDNAYSSVPEAFKIRYSLDLKPFISKYRVDTNRFDPTLWDEILAYGDQGQVYGFPFSVMRPQFFYNKTVFDAFGMAYPQNGMSWENILELSKKVSGTKDGVTYRGLVIEPYHMAKFAHQFGLNYVDSAAGQNNWKSFIQFWKQVYEPPIGANVEPKVDNQTAMALNPPVNPNTSGSWEKITYPTFQAQGGAGAGGLSSIIGIGPKSAHKDLAFQIIDLLTSEEYQLSVVGPQSDSSLMNETIRKHAQTSDPANAGKLVFGKLAPVSKRISVYDKEPFGRTIAADVLVQTAQGQIDAETAINRLDEIFKRNIETQKGEETRAKQVMESLK
ncbi:ABC transporter substrate-binding protein [Paenibacillus sp. MBLB4367]|uniref:ABC transporter substrate-binding protein n=1 Tax=Paenibacillus sp. MBLB4367 TaxID=3384767 RepID=UPI0039082A92